MFTIFEIVPDYDYRDGVCGHRAIAHPYSFVTEAGAEAVATLIARRDEQEEAVFVVRPAGLSPFLPVPGARRPAAPPMDGDIPF